MIDINLTNAIILDELQTMISELKSVQDTHPNPYVSNSYAILRMELKQVFDHFKSFVEQIPLSQLIYDMYYIKDLSIEQIAEELNFPAEKLKVFFDNCILKKIGDNN